MSRTPNINESKLIYKIHEQWARDNGYRSKRQASSTKRFKLQAAGLKPQAASIKLQAASDKLHDS